MTPYVFYSLLFIGILYAGFRLGVNYESDRSRRERLRRKREHCRSRIRAFRQGLEAGRKGFTPLIRS